jgi:hypothetical protein
MLIDIEPTPPNSSPTHMSPPSTTKIRNAFLSLAIMLLEINAGQTLESVRTPQDTPSGQNLPFSPDYSIAQRWLFEQKSGGNMSIGFVTAIENSLNVYTQIRVSLTDADFCAHIQDNVIRPLEAEMQTLGYGV